MGRPERSLESFAACPAPDNPLVAFLGNEGCVPLVSLRSRQCVGDLKMSGTVRTAAFSADGLELLTSGGTCTNPSPLSPFLPTTPCPVQSIHGCMQSLAQTASCWHLDRGAQASGWQDICNLWTAKDACRR